YIPNALHSGNAHQDETAKTVLREARAERRRECPQRGKCPLTGIYGRDFFCSLPFLRNKHAFSRHFKLL
ncbi:hypothetical protein LJB63_23655, partial [[Eubacterium] rectale]|nr:hypothetical protein [Agathobacter rectalis]